jgi:hypothetical protein
MNNEHSERMTYSSWNGAHPPNVRPINHAGAALIESHYEGIKAHVEFLARQTGYGGGVPQFGETLQH